MELRSLIRRFIPGDTSIKVLDVTGHEIVGYIRDLNHTGFRLGSNKPFKIGALMEGLIECDLENQNKHRIPFTGRCVWGDASDFGFSIKDIPISEEKMLDQLIEKISQ